MKRNLVIVFGLAAILTIFLMLGIKIKTNAQVNRRPSPTPPNSNRKPRGNVNASNLKQTADPYPGNAFISNTGEFIAQPIASGSRIISLEDVGVTMIFPRGYEIYDVAKMYAYEADEPDRLFDTRAHLHSGGSDWGIDLMVYTGHNLSFDRSVENSGKLIVGERGFRVLRSNVKSTINGFEVISSSGGKESEVWTIDVFKTPRGGALIVSARGLPQEMKKEQASIQSLLQSIKLK